MFKASSEIMHTTSMQNDYSDWTNAIKATIEILFIY